MLVASTMLMIADGFCLRMLGLRSGRSNHLERDAHVDVLAVADIADVLGVQHVFSAVHLHLHGDG